jgi:MFS family permease
LDTARKNAATSRWVLASLALCTLLPSLGTSIANIALPTLAQAFAASFQQVQWVVLAYLLASTTLMVSVGRLGDLVGHRRLLCSGIALFTAASCLCGVAPGLAWLIAARAVQGLGAAIMMTLAMAFVGQAVPKARTGRALGLLGTMSAVGTALGPSLGGVLIAGFGWPAIFVACVAPGLVAFVLARRCLPAGGVAHASAHGGFDWPGALLMALALAAYALAMTLGHGHFGRLNVGLLALAAIVAGLFVRVEARAASPLIQLAHLRDRALGASLATSTLVSTVMMATLVVGPFYLARALALDTRLIGAVMTAGPVMSALAGMPAGRLVDRFGTLRTTLAALAGMALGCALLCTAPAALGIAGYLVPIAVVTAHYALFQAANNTAVMAGVAPDRRGVVSGLLNLARNLGLVTGASLMGAVFAAASRAGDPMQAPPDAIAAGMRVTFAVAAGLVVVALAIAIAARVRGDGGRCEPGRDPGRHVGDRTTPLQPALRSGARARLASWLEVSSNGPARMSHLPVAPIVGLTALELTPAHAPLLQRFFDDNPGYFIDACGAPARPDEALHEIAGPVPADWPHTKKWVIGYADDQGRLVAMASVVSDLMARPVFHLCVFIVAADRHGNGDAQRLYRGLEHWSHASGAAWMRLGVICGNARAERFWARLGYLPVCRRGGIEMGQRSVVVETRVKPLDGAVLEAYFALVPQDRPVAHAA